MRGRPIPDPEGRRELRQFQRTLVARQIGNDQPSGNVTSAVKVRLPHPELSSRGGEDLGESWTGRDPLLSWNLAAAFLAGNHRLDSLSKALAAQVDLRDQLLPRSVTRLLPLLVKGAIPDRLRPLQAPVPRCAQLAKPTRRRRFWKRGSLRNSS